MIQPNQVGNENPGGGNPFRHFVRPQMAVVKVAVQFADRVHPDSYHPIRLLIGARTAGKVMQDNAAAGQRSAVGQSLLNGDCVDDAVDRAPQRFRREHIIPILMQAVGQFGQPPGDFQMPLLIHSEPLSVGRTAGLR